MAANTLAQITANIHPGKWTKAEMSERWTNLCLTGINLQPGQLWNLLISTGGPDLHDVIKEAEVITFHKAGILKVHYQEFVAAVPADVNSRQGTAHPLYCKSTPRR